MKVKEGQKAKAVAVLEQKAEWREEPKQTHSALLLHLFASSLSYTRLKWNFIFTFTLCILYIDHFRIIHEIVFSR